MFAGGFTILWTILSHVVGFFLKKDQASEQGLKNYMAWNEIMASKGVKHAQERLKAGGQRSRVDDAWAEEEKKILAEMEAHD